MSDLDQNEKWLHVTLIECNISIFHVIYFAGYVLTKCWVQATIKRLDEGGNVILSSKRQDQLLIKQI